MIEFIERFGWIIAGIFLNEFIRWFQKILYKKGQTPYDEMNRKFEEIHGTIEKSLELEEIDTNLYVEYKQMYIHEIMQLADKVMLNRIQNNQVIEKVLDKSEEYNEILDKLRIRLQIDEQPFLIDNFTVKYLENTFCYGVCEHCQFKVCKKYLDVE